MLNETIGRFLLKLQEETNDSEISYFDKYRIGKEIGLVANIQTDHIVEILAKEGYVSNGKENSNIRLTDEGHKRLGNSQV